MNEKTILLGIDPSFVNFGVALYWPDSKKLLMNSGEMLHMVRWIQSTLKANGATLRNVIAYIEDPNRDSTTFNQWVMVKNEIEAMEKYNRWLFRKNGMPPRKSTMSDVESIFRRAMKRAQDVGKNKGSATQFLMMIHERGVPYVTIAPSARAKAYKEEWYLDGEKKKKRLVRLPVKFLTMPTKTTQAQFNELTGYKGRSSEHARDAATLVWGISIRQAENVAYIEAMKRKNKPDSYPQPHNKNSFLIKSNK